MLGILLQFGNITSSTANFIGQQATNFVINSYLTSSNLASAGLAVGGFGVLASFLPFVKNASKGIIILGVLLLVGSGIVLFYGH